MVQFGSAMRPFTEVLTIFFIYAMMVEISNVDGFRGGGGEYY